MTDHISATAVRTNHPIQWRGLVRSLSRQWTEPERKIVLTLESTACFRRQDGKLQVMTEPGGIWLEWNDDQIQWDWKGAHGWPE